MAEKMRTLKKDKHQKKHGFLTRLQNASGKKVIKRRRTKGRKVI